MGMPPGMRGVPDQRLMGGPPQFPNRDMRGAGPPDVYGRQRANPEPPLEDARNPPPQRKVIRVLKPFEQEFVSAARFAASFLFSSLACPPVLLGFKPCLLLKPLSLWLLASRRWEAWAGEGRGRGQAWEAWVAEVASSPSRSRRRNRSRNLWRLTIRTLLPNPSCQSAIRARLRPSQRSPTHGARRKRTHRRCATCQLHRQAARLSPAFRSRRTARFRVRRRGLVRLRQTSLRSSRRAHPPLRLCARQPFRRV